MIPPRIKSQAAKDRELSHAAFRLLCCLVDDRIRRGGVLEDHFTLPWTLASRWLGVEKRASYQAIGTLVSTGYIVKRGRKGVPPMLVFSFGPKCSQKGAFELPEKGAFKGPQEGAFKCPEKGHTLTSNPFGKKAEGKEGRVPAIAGGALEEEEMAEGAAVAGPAERMVDLRTELEEWKKANGL